MKTTKTIAAAAIVAALAAAGCGSTGAPSSSATKAAQHAKAKFDPTPILNRMEKRQGRLLVLSLQGTKDIQAGDMEAEKDIEVRMRVLIRAQRRDFNRLDAHREGLSSDVLKKIDTWGETIDQAEEDQASVEATN
jgi:hypothetical protein